MLDVQVETLKFWEDEQLGEPRYQSLAGGSVKLGRQKSHLVHFRMVGGISRRHRLARELKGQKA
ncbi:hypothetical protein H5410_041321 [Solanum commersonii]|uniref:Uncharacterized protein n=1 Tax=Solanum commersonii TaxID=4109 RepID=A0A9J5XTA8_SOLCO|nr:hypothetical protein H5410_041321 [Solanum commersonii]